MKNSKSVVHEPIHYKRGQCFSTQLAEYSMIFIPVFHYLPHMSLLKARLPQPLTLCSCFIMKAVYCYSLHSFIYMQAGENESKNLNKWRNIMNTDASIQGKQGH